MREMLSTLEASLARMPEEVGETPKAILMISGHWEDDDFAVMSSPRPPMVYDYSNFPPETYEIVYPAPGAPDIAARAADLIRAAGLETHLDPDQGFDHGTFVPAYVMYPDAQVPVFQVAIRHDYDPADHFALGRALAPLREEGVLIVGSGLSYHNLRLMNQEGKIPSAAFDAWLDKTLALPPKERTAALIDWESAPHARTCHAQEDHLVPIFAALGAAEDAKATRVYHDPAVFGAITASSYRFD
ncbi:DODA-type extradiol aromatic ring-opening family dioxygenase [Flavimaricola marinus]|nr:class III extradiol ring-cleavage dioxygenase [Flavimaricola marinus]